MICQLKNTSFIFLNNLNEVKKLFNYSTDYDFNKDYLSLVGDVEYEVEKKIQIIILI